MAVRQFALPTGARVVGAVGPNLLVRIPNGPPAPATLETLSFAADGSSTAIPVTRLPDGAFPVSLFRRGQDSFLPLSSGGTTPEQYALVDIATARATVLPADITRVTGAVIFSTDHLAIWNGLPSVRTASIYPLAALEAGEDPAPTVVPLLPNGTFTSS